jgi:hypothetical protein
MIVVSITAPYGFIGISKIVLSQYIPLSVNLKLRVTCCK